MPPTEALFDAINRGDAEGARDALNRGAETDVKNVLGLLPVELAVDLNRSDIVFMLLAARGEGGGASAQTQRAGANAANARTAKAPAQQTALTRAAARRVAEQTAPAVPAPRRAASAQQYARDGGTANPSAGFLGYDASPSAGDRP